jgi:hypothetical protein
VVEDEAEISSLGSLVVVDNTSTIDGTINGSHGGVSTAVTDTTSAQANIAVELRER